MNIPGISETTTLHRNLSPDDLMARSVEKGEGVISAKGALTLVTAPYTGRSPNDRFLVEDDITRDEADWGKVNVKMSPEHFEGLRKKITTSLDSKEELFVFDGFVGANESCRLPVRIVTNRAAGAMFIQNMLRRPTAEELENFEPEFLMYADTTCAADPAADGTNSEAFVTINMSEKMILIGTTKYCGEMKKAFFSVMNYLLPKKDIFPMHCSANTDDSGNTALFFGLSGTGKTTLSADLSRQLIGDDEHGWSSEGVFNFEGGCYAKCINLKEENEPQIYRAIRKGSIVENAVMDEETKEYDFEDTSITQNSRVSYPIEFIDNHVPSGAGSHPKTVIFLTADAFGVLPPVAKLTAENAMYHFISGYTSKLAGTERGVTEPQATFSAFFGAPFMPLKPMVYANLLKKYTEEYACNVFLINTGWTGGSYGTGERISLKDTRAIVTAAINGDLNDVEYRHDDVFNLDVPVSCPDVEASILDPKSTWTDGAAYDEQAAKLATMFHENFQQFDGIEDAVKQAGPKH